MRAQENLTGPSGQIERILPPEIRGRAVEVQLTIAGIEHKLSQQFGPELTGMQPAVTEPAASPEEPPPVEKIVVDVSDITQNGREVKELRSRIWRIHENDQEAA